MITSSGNPQIKQIRALRQRKEREASGRFFIEGIRLVAEALAVAGAVERLVVAPELLASDFARQLLDEHAPLVEILEVSAEVFANLSQKDGPQGIGAIVQQRWEQLADWSTQTGLGWVALDEIGDPGNLGTIIRTTDAVGTAGVILIGRTTDPYDPAALRASMGAIFAVPHCRVEWSELLAWKEQHHLALIGTSDAATNDYRRVKLPLPNILLMGSERQGLSQAQLAECDLTLSLPMRGRSDSLNLAVATGVLLYENLRQAEG